MGEVISFEARRLEKENRIKIPVFESIRMDENGELKGKLVDHLELPKHVIKRERNEQ